MSRDVYIHGNLLGRLMAEIYKPMREPVRLDSYSWKCFRSGCTKPAQVKMGYCPECFKRVTHDPYPRPNVVVLCGSTRFKQTWHDVNKWATHRGFIVLTVGDLDTSESAANVNAPIDPDLKSMLDELHKRKIDMADVVLILNVGGYIGESTRSEIEYAEWHDKPIVYLETAP